MSNRSRALPRRPVSRHPLFRALPRQAPTATTDFSFLDLEDSVAPNEKVARAPKSPRRSARLTGMSACCVFGERVGHTVTYGDVIDVVTNLASPRRGDAPQGATGLGHRGARPSPHPGRTQRRLAPGHIGIEAQIETARGLINVEEICAASPRLESIVFGPADFAASIGMPVTTIDETITTLVESLHLRLRQF